ncbi:antitoxin [Prauserella alba]|uniref:MT0933-like antitoxin protein n=1 Tax=Prauserella alba TaxID=176898 RepID=A0ABN1V9C7_9PSEU|nr:antitoxin [Prauserella alba]MCP2181743.1 MT0933-like antitoxin protein [Prauserella alba]
MGINFGEIKKKAQDALSKNSDKVEQGLDKASGFAKSKFGDKADKIDNATQKAKDALHKQTGDEGDQGGGQGGQQPGPSGPTGQ